MAAKPDMAMIAAMKPDSAGSAPDDSAPPSSKAGGPPDVSADVSDEEMGFAKDMGFDAVQAGALKRFIKSCMAADEAGEYDDTGAAEATPSTAEPPPGGM